MRYQNWDVLLFPDGSKIPVQEFKTQCFVTRDLDSPFLRNPSVPGFPYLSDGKASNQMPVLTTFVASLVHNSAYRVSVHSWEKPRPSRATETLMGPDDSVMFEARVYVDGVCVSGSVFGQRAQWPHVIDSSSQVDKNGNQDALRFPPFHQEILHQNHWDAAESLGRIKVVIAEGCSRPHRTPPFERVRDVLIFSFQHAPLHILEFSGIAWPNPGMWTQVQPRNIYSAQPAGAPSVQKEKENEDAHAHSPSRRSMSSESMRRSGSGSGSFGIPYLPWSYRNPMPPPAIPWHTVPEQDPVRSPAYPISDPFIDAFHGNPGLLTRRGGRSSLEDVPMPDYVSLAGSSLRSRAPSSMTDGSYEQKRDARKSAREEGEAIGALAEAPSPFKNVSSGTSAPANSPSSVPVVTTRPSAAAEARSASYPHSANRAVSLEVHEPLISREVSSTSLKSGDTKTTNNELVAHKTHASPCSMVKGRKEGKDASEQKENEPDPLETHWTVITDQLTGRTDMSVDIEHHDTIVMISEMKRKRPVASSEAVSGAVHDVTTPSPSKKASKVSEAKPGSFVAGEDTGEGGVSVRTPLQKIGASID